MATSSSTTVKFSQYTSSLQFGGIWISSDFYSHSGEYRLCLALKSTPIDRPNINQRITQPSQEIAVLAIDDGTERQWPCQGTATMNFEFPRKRHAGPGEVNPSFKVDFSIREPTSIQLDCKFEGRRLPVGLMWTSIPQDCIPFYLECDPPSGRSRYSMIIAGASQEEIIMKIEDIQIIMKGIKRRSAASSSQGHQTKKPKLKKSTAVQKFNVVSATPDLLTINDLVAVQNATWSARSKGYNIGLNLGIQPGTLDAIFRDNRSCDDHFTDTLKCWLRQSDPKPTWGALADALRSPSVDEGALADQLPQHTSQE